MNSLFARLACMVFMVCPLATVAVNGAEPKAKPPGISLSAEGLSVNVSAFTLDGESFPAASIKVARMPGWFVGMSLLNKELMLLPRLGHRGWIPLARLDVDSAGRQIVVPLQAQMPASRLQKTSAVLSSRKPLTVLVLGSSLLHANSSTRNWPNILFANGLVHARGTKGRVQPVFRAMPAAGNIYQLAQLGDEAHIQQGTLKKSSASVGLLQGIDLVIIGTLANSGQDWQAVAEQIFNKLQAAGVEVIVVTDNAIKSPGVDFRAERMFQDGYRLIEMANLYGFEVADTAAFVAAADALHPGKIYRDHIHMSLPRSVGPASEDNGQQVWANALASVLSNRSMVPEARGAEKSATRVAASTTFLVLKADKMDEAPAERVALQVNPVTPSAGLRLLSEDRPVSFKVECLKSAYAVWYGDQKSAPASLEFTVNQKKVLTKLAGALPFPNEWVTKLYESETPLNGQATLRVTQSQARLVSIITESTIACR